MIYTLQNSPELIPFRRKINLTEFLAVKLIFERAFVMSENHFKRAPHFEVKTQKSEHLFNDEHVFDAFRILQESFEESTYEKVLYSLNIINSNGIRN